MGIPEKYYKQALKERKSIEIHFQGKKMKIPFAKLESKKIGKSKPQQDKFGREDYYLIYFGWRPMTEDEEMEDFCKTYL